MKRLHANILLTLALTVMATGCVAVDEPMGGGGGTETVGGGENLIVVNAAAPSDDAMLTRYPENGPTLTGYCYADKLRLAFYNFEYGSTTNSNDVTNSKYEYLSGKEVSLEKTKPNEVNDQSVDRYTTSTFNINIKSAGWGRYGLSMTGFAYTEADGGLFEYTLGANRTEPKLTLNEYIIPEEPGTPEESDDEELTPDLKRYKTPEVYFGFIKYNEANLKNIPGFKGAWNHGSEYPGGKLSGEAFDIKDQYFYYSFIDINYDMPLNGEIFRSVGQVNVKLTVVPRTGIKKMKLLASNFPLEINLYGKHGGDIYPLSAVTDVAKTTGSEVVVLDETDEVHDGTATLSSFVLPSEVGMLLKVRVYFEDNVSITGLKKDKEGKYKDFAITPDKDAAFGGSSAAVYNVGPALVVTGEGGESQRKVYDKAGSMFYTYSNVRLNVTGTMQSIMSEDVDVTLEIEPAFVKAHYIDIVKPSN